MRLAITACLALGCRGGAAPAGWNAASSPSTTPTTEPTEIPTAASDASIVRAPSPVIWRGRSDGLAFEWGAEGLRVSGGPRPLELFAKPEAYAECESEVSYRLLSVVGAVVSYERSDSTDCKVQAHPMHHTSYVAVDAAHGGREVKLTELFPEHDVLQALLGDRLVRAALSRTGAAPPSSLDALVSELARNAETPCEYAFDDGLLRHFAFHHVEKSDGGPARVAVRLGLSHGCELARGNLTQLGILLPLDHPPSAFVRALGNAERRTEGLLMEDALRIAGDRSTDFQVGDSSTWTPGRDGD